MSRCQFPGALGNEFMSQGVVWGHGLLCSFGIFFERGLHIFLALRYATGLTPLLSEPLHLSDLSRVTAACTSPFPALAIPALPQLLTLTVRLLWATVSMRGPLGPWVLVFSFSTQPLGRSGHLGRVPVSVCPKTEDSLV